MGDRDTILHENPHVVQKYLNKGHPIWDNIPFTRILRGSVERLKYRSRKGEDKSVIHWGQRKLLLSEIEFLTLYGSNGKTVVYVGAAPGTHIALLSELFPHIHFILIDPAPFTVVETDKIKIYQCLFTDKMAKQFGKKYPGLLFISDIRSADFEIDSSQVVEEKVRWDMDMQQKWHIIMRPERSMLKFRLPWDDGRTPYLKGDIYLPIWGPVSTTETRLITRENSVSMRNYDNRQYEEQMFYFNNEMRPSLYSHDFDGEGIDHCYDCRAEIDVLASYFDKFVDDGEIDVRDWFAIMSARLSKRISPTRTLLDENVDPEDRRQRIRSRQWIDGRPAYETGK